MTESADPNAQSYPAGYPPPPSAYTQPGYPQSGPTPTGATQAGYPQAGYPQAGYPTAAAQPGYAQPTYPAQPTYQQAGYAQPGYPAAGYPAAAYPSGYAPVVVNRRPGSLTGAAVLAFIQAGVVLISSIFCVAGASEASDLVGSNQVTTVIIILGLAGFVAGVLLIVGGVKTFSGITGLLVGGCGLSIALSVGWFIFVLSESNDVGGSFVVPLLYAILPAIAWGLALTQTARAWRRTA